MGGQHLIGYDPARIAALRRRTIAATEHLVGITSSDPMAWEPLTAVGRARFGLETIWLPALARVAADPSMSDWSRSAPGLDGAGRGGGNDAASPRPGPLGADTAAALLAFDNAFDGLYEGDDPDEALADLADLLLRYGDDAVVMSALLDEWGAAGLFERLMIVAAYGEAGAAVATDLLATVDRSDHAGDPSFGSELGAAAAAAMAAPAESLDAFAAASSAAVVALIADTAPPGFALAFADGVTDHAMAGGAFVGLVGAPNNLPAADGPTSIDFVSDPVAAALTIVARDPAAAAAFYLDPERSRYVFAEHQFADGYTALFTSWAAACAGRDLRDPDDPPNATRAHEANVIATQGVAWLAGREGFDPADASADASAAAADVVTTHLIAVEATVVSPGSIDLTGEGTDPPLLPSVDHDSVAGDDLIEVALFDSVGLDLLVGTAGTTDAGIETVRAGATAFAEHTAAGLADELAFDLTHGGDPTVASLQLQAAVDRAGHLDGYLLDALWEVQQDAGRERDELIGFWIDNATSVVQLGVGPTAAGPFTAALPAVRAALTGRFATSETRVITEATTFADEQAGRLTFVYAAALAGAGLIDMPGMVGVTAPTYEQFQALPEAERVEFWSDLAHGGAGYDLMLAPTAAADAIKVEQVEMYNGA